MWGVSSVFIAWIPGDQYGDVSIFGLETRLDGWYLSRVTGPFQERSGIAELAESLEGLDRWNQHVEGALLMLSPGILRRDPYGFHDLTTVRQG